MDIEIYQRSLDLCFRGKKSAFMNFSGGKALWTLLGIAGLGFCTLSVALGRNPFRYFGILPNGSEYRGDLTIDQGYRIEVPVQTPNGVKISYSVVHVYGWDKQTLQGGLSNAIFAMAIKDFRIEK